MEPKRLEKNENLQGPETKPASEKIKTPDAKELKAKAKDILQSSESAEGQEGVELSEGIISEQAGEDKVFAPMAGVKTYTADQIEAIRAKLLSAIPPQEVMIQQITGKLMKRQKALTKRKSKLQKKAHRYAFELTIVIAQLREIRRYFSILAHATYEMIKHLWLKIVHGV